MYVLEQFSSLQTYSTTLHGNRYIEKYFSFKTMKMCNDVLGATEMVFRAVNEHRTLQNKYLKQDHDVRHSHLQSEEQGFSFL